MSKLYKRSENEVYLKKVCLCSHKFALNFELTNRYFEIEKNTNVKNTGIEK